MKKGSSIIKGTHTPRHPLTPAAIGMMTPKVKQSSRSKSPVGRVVTSPTKKPLNAAVVASNSESRENRSRAGFAPGLSNVYKPVKKMKFGTK